MQPNRTARVYVIVTGCALLTGALGTWAIAAAYADLFRQVVGVSPPRAELVHEALTAPEPVSAASLAVIAAAGSQTFRQWLWPVVLTGLWLVGAIWRFYLADLPITGVFLLAIWITPIALRFAGAPVLEAPRRPKIRSDSADHMLRQIGKVLAATGAAALVLSAGYVAIGGIDQLTGFGRVYWDSIDTPGLWLVALTNISAWSAAPRGRPALVLPAVALLLSTLSLQLSEVPIVAMVLSAAAVLLATVGSRLGASHRMGPRGQLNEDARPDRLQVPERPQG